MAAGTRDTILEVAARLFVQQGYTATSIRQIAEGTGIGKATIYHHFPDKRAIALALFESRMARGQEYVAAVEAETDPRRRIEFAVEQALRFVFESAELMSMVRREVPEGWAQVRAQSTPFMRKLMALLAEALRQGAEQGAFRPVDPAAGARVLMAMVQGSFALTHVGVERAPAPEKAARVLLDVFFNGVVSR